MLGGTGSPRIRAIGASVGLAVPEFARAALGLFLGLALPLPARSPLSERSGRLLGRLPLFPYCLNERRSAFIPHSSDTAFVQVVASST